MDAHELADLERLAGLGLTQAQIADWFGFSKRTLANRLGDEKVAAIYKKGRARALEKVTGMLWRNIEKGDTASIFFYLKTQGGWRETDPNMTRDANDTATQVWAYIRAGERTMSGGDE